MSSKRRRQASRANGKKSRGPKTREGKARSSQNALRHGFLSRQVVLENESDEQFKLLFDQYAGQFCPGAAAEFGFLEEMIASYWRMRRAWAIEKQSMDEALAEQPRQSPLADLAGAWRCLASNPDTALLYRYETMMHQRFNRAFQNFLQLKRLPVPNEPSPKIGHSAPLAVAPLPEPSVTPAPAETPDPLPPPPATATRSRFRDSTTIDMRRPPMITSFDIPYRGQLGEVAVEEADT